MNKVDARRKNPFPTQKYDMRLALVAYFNFSASVLNPALLNKNMRGKEIESV